MFPSQIKTLEERRLSLPAASSFPRRTTGNEVDTPQPTPVGPPSHQPAGACPLTLTTHANVTPKSLISSLLQAEAPQGPWAHRGFPVLMDLPVRLEEKESLEQSVKHTRRTSTLVLFAAGALMVLIYLLVYLRRTKGGQRCTRKPRSPRPTGSTGPSRVGLLPRPTAG